MRILKQLEKSHSFWLLLKISLLFFILRIPSLIEPYWYGDEGIYEVLGLAISKGHMLYSQIWDNKPPLLYLTYALFSGDQNSVRLLSLISGIISLIIFYYLAQKLFQRVYISATITILYTVLFATPFIEGNIANAENFMLLPIIAGALFLYGTVVGKDNTVNTKLFAIKHTPFLAGILLGIGFLYKIVALFDFAAFFIFLFIIATPEKLQVKSIIASGKKIVPTVFSYCIGFIVPLFITVLYFYSQHALGPFVQATFFGNIGYVGYGNTFIIPQGLLILKLLLLVGVIITLFLLRKKLPKQAIFILLWSAFSLFDAFFSQRPYTHYVLVLLPSFCLLVGLPLAAKIRKMQYIYSVFILILLLLVSYNFHFYGTTKTLQYYQNAFLFMTAKKDVTSYESFFDKKTPRDYQVATFIKMHTKPEDNVFIWGDNAQIYVLANKLPPGRYTVAYHISQTKTGIKETREALNTVQPKYIITLQEAPLLPFSLPMYAEQVTFQGATIYEKIY